MQVQCIFEHIGIVRVLIILPNICLLFYQYCVLYYVKWFHIFDRTGDVLF